MNLFNSIKVDWLFSKGQNHFSKNELDIAVEVYDKALAINPNYSGIYLHKALALSKNIKYNEAEAAINKALELKPESDVYNLFAGIIHLENGKLNKAKEHFNRSLDINKSYSFAKQYNALTSIIDNDVKFGLEVLLKESMPDDNRFRAIMYIRIHDLIGKLDETDIKLFKDLRNKIFDKKEGFLSRFFKNKDVDKKEDPELVLTKKEQYFEEEFERAQQLQTLKAHKKSIEICENMLKQEPEFLFNLKFSLLLAESYFYEARYSDGEQAYKNLIILVNGDLTGLQKHIKKTTNNSKIEKFYSNGTLLCKKTSCGDKLIYCRAYSRRRLLAFDSRYQLEINYDDLSYFNYKIGKSQFNRGAVDEAYDSFTLANRWAKKDLRKSIAYYLGVIQMNRNNLCRAIHNLAHAFEGAPIDTTFENKYSALINRL